MRRILLFALLPAFLLAGCGDEVRRIHYAGGDQLWSVIRYRDEVPEGAWTTWWENGNRKSLGVYREGRRHAEWTTWFENGDVRTIQSYRYGQPHGLWAHWFASGVHASTGHFDQGKRDGLWEEWYPDGKPRVSVEFDLGTQVGTTTTWFENGNKKREEVFEDDVAVHRTLWFRNGQKQAEGPANGPPRVGVWQAWKDDGSPDPERSGRYENGIKVAD